MTEILNKEGIHRRLREEENTVCLIITNEENFSPLYRYRQLFVMKQLLEFRKILGIPLSIKDGKM